MATKTFKIGEYCRGGIITVETKKDKIILIGKDWDMSQGTRKSSNQSNAKEWTRRIISVHDEDCYRKCMVFLEDLTTHYYADNIMKWVKTKIDIKEFWSMW